MKDMNLEFVLKVCAIAVSAYVVGASVYLWDQRPERPWPYVLSMGIVAFAWLVRYVACRRITADVESHATGRKLLSSITGAALLMAIPLTRQLGLL